jgi:hypothetical protein
LKFLSFIKSQDNLCKNCLKFRNNNLSIKTKFIQYLNLYILLSAMKSTTTQVQVIFHKHNLLGRVGRAKVHTPQHNTTHLESTFHNLIKLVLGKLFDKKIGQQRLLYGRALASSLHLHYIIINHNHIHTPPHSETVPPGITFVSNEIVAYVCKFLLSFFYYSIVTPPNSTHPSPPHSKVFASLPNTTRCYFHEFLETLELLSMDVAGIFLFQNTITGFCSLTHIETLLNR